MSLQWNSLRDVLKIPLERSLARSTKLFCDDLSLTLYPKCHYHYIPLLDLPHASVEKLLQMPHVPTRSVLFRLMDPSPQSHLIEPMIKSLNSVVSLPPIGSSSLLAIIEGYEIFWVITSEKGEVQWAFNFEEISGWQEQETSRRKIPKKARRTPPMRALPSVPSALHSS